MLLFAGLVICTIAIMAYLDFSLERQAKWQAANFQILRDLISDMALDLDIRLGRIEREATSSRRNSSPTDY